MRAYGILLRPADPKHPEMGSERENLEAIERAGGGRAAALDAVHVPPGFDYLWRLFWEVYAGGTETMSGIRLSWRDLADYQTVTGVRLDAFEVEAIMAMDRALREAMSKGATGG